jgi:hypothetical protein
MSKHTQPQAQQSLTSDQLKALTVELAAKKRLVKEQQELQEWEEKTTARNPRFVPGSVRRPTEADTAALGHVHGLVCEIACESCGKVRVINKQDAFQVRYCQDCRKVAGKAAGRDKRLVKKLAGTSRQELEQQIAQLNALLASKAA